MLTQPGGGGIMISLDVDTAWWVGIMISLDVDTAWWGGG